MEHILSRTAVVGMEVVRGVGVVRLVVVRGAVVAGRDVEDALVDDDVVVAAVGVATGVGDVWTTATNGRSWRGFSTNEKHLPGKGSQLSLYGLEKIVSSSISHR